MAETIWWQGRRPDPAAINANGAQSLQALLEIEFTEVGEDWLVARMPVTPRVHQPWGRLHGGASLVLAETMASVGASLVVDPEQFVAVGMEINANHVRPIHSGWVIGTARPESRGRTTQIWSIRITDEAGKLVCISRFTAAVIALQQV